jgi:hypothetical protein
MGAEWQIVAFPVILPWREEFWTLPLYFPDLKVGVTPGWPSQVPYQGMPLPPEAEAHPMEYKHYQPGDLRQWQAFANHMRAEEGEGDLLHVLRQYGEPRTQEQPAPPNISSLAWQLEKMQADQDAQMVLVDQGQAWLKDILAPEPWEERPAFGPVPGVEEMVDPDLAKLRYHFWRRVMAPYLHDSWAPLLLGRTSRALFLTLKGWPEWTALQKLEILLPGCRSAAEWTAVAGEKGVPPWQREFKDRLADVLQGASDPEKLLAAARELNRFVEDELAAHWPRPEVWRWELEVWAPEGSAEAEQPILCWAGAGAGILPG